MQRQVRGQNLDALLLIYGFEMYVCMYVCMYLFIYEYMYVCMHV